MCVHVVIQFVNNQQLHRSYTEAHIIQHVANMGIVPIQVPVLREARVWE